MFLKLKNEMKQNKNLKYAVISIPLLVLFAAYTLYNEFAPKQESNINQTMIEKVAAILCYIFSRNLCAHLEK